MFEILKKPKHHFEVVHLIEQCKNPIKPDCNNEDIVVYIQINQEKYPICQKCWNQLAETTIDWDKVCLKNGKTNK
jgi:hypothetical protein